MSDTDPRGKLQREVEREEERLPQQGDARGCEGGLGCVGVWSERVSACRSSSLLPSRALRAALRSRHSASCITARKLESVASFCSTAASVRGCKGV